MNEGKNIPEKLKKILSDNRSGSEELLLKLNSFLLSHYRGAPIPKYIIREIKKAFSPFQNISSYLRSIEKLKDIKEIKIHLENYSRADKNKFNSIFENACPLLKGYKRIITFSNSRTVAEILKRLGKLKRGLTVVVPECRPANEGRIMAKLLAGDKIKVEYITEAMLPEYIEGCGCALIGADKIFPNGDILNKTGSRALAILCRHFKIPLYAAADHSKITSYSKTGSHKKNPAEVWKNPPAGVKVSNYYFERVEKKYIKKLITD